MKEITCPNCGQTTAECSYHGDVGGPEYYIDLYQINCSNCEFKLSSTQPGGSPLAQNHGTNCPWCKMPHCHHQKLESFYLDPTKNYNQDMVGPFMSAIRTNDPEVVKFLLECKVSPNAIEDGISALAMASKYSDEKMKQLLISAGAVAS